MCIRDRYRTIRRVKEHGRVQTLYQQLAQWTRLRKSTQTVSRTVHTEVTVERQGVTVLMEGVAAAGFDACPLCGQKLRVPPTKEPRLRLQQDSMARKTFRTELPREKKAPTQV